ncbi:MAG: hypothetical protein M1826_000379 [Phylliscum demangeonii]|nr:MAG: hypothetical protein M1826_000379 [Phylliscum demangeonii]
MHVILLRVLVVGAMLSPALAAMAIPDRNGPWSRPNPPPYNMPDIGSENLPSDMLDASRKYLTEQQITDLEREEPAHAEVFYHLEASQLQELIHVTVYNFMAAERADLRRSELLSEIAEQESQYRKSSADACLLEEQARECLVKATRAQHKIEELKQQLGELNSLHPPRQGQQSKANANANATPNANPDTGAKNEFSAAGVGHPSPHGFLGKTGFAVDGLLSSVQHKSRPLLHRLQSTLGLVGARAQTLSRDGTARVLRMERAGDL